ncbi:MAG TPA: DNA/RNA non-specific endonuclease [Thermoanaerobaculia bacterium]|nr:DNA/RNA non-specific endonuclease [Thermoanaerobaculia bacterium]
MNARRLALGVAFCFLIAANAAFAASNVVISQLYGGGGNSGAALKNDFIEIFNRGNAAQSLSGWSVQYGSSGGTTWTVTNLTNVTLQPGQYYLIQESAGTGGTVSLPTPDATGSIAMSATAAKVALVSSTTALTGACPTGGAIVDMVGFGAANCAEGTPTATLTNTTAAIRNNAGCTDTDSNAGDFSIAAPSPRNTATALHTCNLSNNPPVINAPANPITTVLQNAAPFNVGLTGSDDNNALNWSATPGSGVSSVVVSAGQGTNSVTYTVTLVTNYTGTATFTAWLSDGVNQPVNQAVNITVNSAPVNNPPAITPPANPITTVEENAPAFIVQLTGTDDNAVYNWSAAAGTGVSSVNVTAGQTGATATFTVTLQGGFAGTATFTASLSDNVNAAVNQTVNISVTPPPPPANHVVISQVYGGGGNSGATYQNDYIELYNPTASPVDMTGWTLQYQAAASTGNWTGFQPIGGVIGPGEYFLVQLASGGATGAPLPAPNIDGSASINMSATAGKIALVGNGDPLSNCPFNVDPDLIDMVGYGTTANCREGSTNAPASSNTTALFRKNSGATDTDVNGADFVAGAPNPRRTAPIQEIGPFVVTVDPSSGNTIAPHDASVTITFSEPVFVDANWFSITCTSTGVHSDATNTSTPDGATWVITPNVSFDAGETCTVTIFKDKVHDVDTNDSGPGTDTLPADKVWSFSVATGDPAPYPPSVHLTMGNPSNAIDDVNVPNNYLMVKPTYAESYNRDKGTPNWVSWHLNTSWYGSLVRLDTFRPDPKVPADWYRVQAFDFSLSGFDRGHMCPNADRDNENRRPINQETYLMSNMVPQAPDNNQGPWANLEAYLRTLTDAGSEIYIVSGPAGVGGTGSNGGVTTSLAGGHVTVPAYTWKVALVLPNQDGDDVARVSASTRTIAVIMPNVQGIRTNNSSDWMTYLTSVHAVEQLTGYNFYSNVPQVIQNAFEYGVNGDNPPGTADQSVSTNEDNGKTFTLTVANPTANTLTYNILTNPAHGTLSGSNGSETYTPAPDFNGTDTFTYNVSDGTHTSNTATVTITVLEVNDAPAAANDAKTVNEDSSITFPGSDLTANDSAGPANESAQTLTVTSVNSTADTHGTVTLNNGQVTYTPAPLYFGNASFTYQVCDNGVTAGVADPQCAAATVNVTVNFVNHPPAASINAPSTGIEGSPISVTGGATDVDPGESFTFAFSVTKNGSPYASGSGTPFSFTPDDNGTYVVSEVVTDSHGGQGTASATINVSNAVPVIASVTGPTTALPISSATATINVSYSDAGSADTQTATFAWGDSTTSTVACSTGTCSATHTYSRTGLYHVTVTVTDDDGGSAVGDFQYVVVYDTMGGFVTGGGWINSPAGAYVTNPTATGKATFNLSAKYQKGVQLPQGSASFQFAGISFTGTSYDWLVITGNQAYVEGTGTIASMPGTFGFLVAATDGPDAYRIKIWDTTTGTVVYDDVTAQNLGGGNVQIH